MPPPDDGWLALNSMLDRRVTCVWAVENVLLELFVTDCLKQFIRSFHRCRNVTINDPRPSILCTRSCLALRRQSHATMNDYRHFRDVVVRYARWDLRRVDLVDPQSGVILSPIYLLDRSSNADGRRGTLDPDEGETPDEDDQSGAQSAESELPPLLKRILEEYSATGMPPAYLPQKPDSQNEGEAS